MVSNILYKFKNPSNFRGVFCLIFFVLTTSHVDAQAILSFKRHKESFGFVKKGELVKVEFKFVNTGNQPLIITEAKVECSCTTVEYPKQPIAPNQSGVVLVLFDTKSVYDRQDRVVEIISNASNSSEKIRFKGVVLK